MKQLRVLQVTNIVHAVTKTHRYYIGCAEINKDAGSCLKDIRHSVKVELAGWNRIFQERCKILKKERILKDIVKKRIKSTE